MDFFNIMPADKYVQAVSAILFKADQSNSKALFIRGCLEILIDLFDCAAASIWFSGDSLYQCSRTGPNAPSQSPPEKSSPETFSMDIRPIENFPDQLLNRLCSSSPAPVFGLNCCNGICWSGNIHQALSENRFSEGELSFIADMTGKDRSSLMLTAFSTRMDGPGILLLSGNTDDHFTPARISGFKEILPILETAFLNWHTHLALQERVKELTCLYQMARVDETAQKNLEDILREIVAIVPSAWLYPEDACVRIKMDERSFPESGFPEDRPKLAADIVLNGTRRGLIEIAYRREHPLLDEGPFLQEERKLLDALARELTLIIERKLFEKEKTEIIDRLKHADRLNMIGQLSAAVAHEINEPLTALLGYAQLAAKCPGLPRQAQDDIDKIISTSLHAREIVRKLLMFARKMPSRAGEVNVNDILTESLHFFEARCEKEKIAVELRLSPELAPIRADLSQLRQVFSNLILNAIQAMPGGGKLSLETRGSANEILVSVKDTGNGMTREIMEKIFIPFFTTKPHYQGTGLGLPVVQEIVAAHGGTVSVQSEPGRGTCFDLRFPGRGQP